MNVQWLVATLDDAGYARLFGAGKTSGQWFLLGFSIDEELSPQQLYDRTLRGDSSFMRGILQAIPDDDFTDECMGAMDDGTRHHDF